MRPPQEVLFRMETLKTAAPSISAMKRTLWSGFTAMIWNYEMYWNVLVFWWSYLSTTIHDAGDYLGRKSNCAWSKKTPTLHCGAKGSLTSFPKKCYTAEQHHVRREVQSKGCLPANSDVSDGVRCPLKEERMHGFHVIGNFWEANCLSIVVLLSYGTCSLFPCTTL